MKFRFSSMVQKASSVAARRMYGDFGAPVPLVVIVVVSDIDFLTKYSWVICRKIWGVGWIGRAAELRASNPSRHNGQGFGGGGGLAMRTSVIWPSPRSRVSAVRVPG